MKEFLKELFLTTIIGVAIFVAIFFVVGIFLVLPIISGTGYLSCWQNLSDSGKEYRYKILKGCQYKSADGWLQYDRLRDIN